MLKSYLKKKLPRSQRLKLRNITNDILSIGSGYNLDKLGKIYGTDKFGEHFYTQHYKHHFRKYKFKRIKLLEIGVGGYKDPYAGGNSLRMWKRYFPLGKIFSLDIENKSPLNESRIKIFKGSQVDEPFLNAILQKTRNFDLIIDDGSHINEHVITTFNILFPKLNDGGIYVIEDTQTSYWEGYGGDSSDLQNPNTMMNYFKNLTDSLNNKEFLIHGYQQSYFDKKIISIHFYHNMIFIYKGNNDEESNIVTNNQM